MNCDLGKKLVILAAATTLCMLYYLHLKFLSDKLRGFLLIDHQYLSTVTQLQNSSGKLCLVYDKAPRTASSTISSALRKCWTKYKYKYPHANAADYRTTISKMLNLSSDRVAVTGVHFTMPTSEVQLLQKKCAHLFYVTSTRTMTERIASKAKYEASNGKISINTTLSQHALQEALRNAVNDKSSEFRMERYPFPEPEQRIKPDYIIRHEHFTDDLQFLLRAFRCPEHIRSRNVHDIEREEQSGHGDDTFAMLNDVDSWPIDLKFNDYRHLTLSKMAERRNNISIGKLKLFID